MTGSRSKIYPEQISKVFLDRSDNHLGVIFASETKARLVSGKCPEKSTSIIFKGTKANEQAVLVAFLTNRYRRPRFSNT